MSNLVNDFEVRKETLKKLGGDPTGLANIYEVDLEILKRIGSGGGEGIPDAPVDGVQYARQNGEWTPVESGIDWNTIKQKLAEDGVESIKFIMGNEQVILTATELKTLLNQTVLPDAPSDGKQYARQNGNWTPVEEGLTDAPSDGTQYARQNGNWTPVESVEPGIPDAPTDGQQYARQNGNWTPVEEGLNDAPTDGQQYARQNGNWTPVESVEPGIPDAPVDGVQYARQNGDWTPVKIPTVEKYLTMTADESNSGAINIHPNIEGELPNLNLQYRVNGGDWNDFIIGTTNDITAQPGDVIQWKGNNPNGVSYDYNFLKFSIPIVGSNHLHLSGNIMSLIDGIGETTVVPNRLCFYGMFRFSAIKTVSPDFLPAMTLQEECYRDLFSYCQILTQAPELPATTLASGCYNGMFNECSKLNYVQCSATNITATDAINNWLSGVASTGTFVKPDGVSYPTGTSGIPSNWTVKESDVIEVPNDGKQYTRQNGVWVEAEPSKVKTTSNTTLQFWSGTQQEYDAIATKDANTLYVIS